MKGDEKEIRGLRHRIEYLEESRRYILNALEMALSIGDFQSEIENRATEVEIFLEAEKRLHRLMNFQLLAFYMVNPENSDFMLKCLTPEGSGARIEKEMDFMIEKGIVAWALREKRGVIVPSENHSAQVLLHVIATNSKIRGMVAGILNPVRDAVPDISLELLSIILRNAANALENIELIETIAVIREQKKAEEVRRRHEKLKTVVEMSGAICHEMNQPLMIVSGITELILPDAENKGRTRQYLEKIKKQIDRLGDITHKLQNINNYATKRYLKGKIVDLDRAGESGDN